MEDCFRGKARTQASETGATSNKYIISYFYKAHSSWQLYPQLADQLRLTNNED
jgi:hypothetical protein